MYVKDEPLAGMKFKDDGKQQQQQQAVIQETANIKSLNDGLNSLVQAAGIATIIEEAPIIRPSQAAVQYNRAVAEATDVRVQVKDANQEQQTMAVSIAILNEYCFKLSVFVILFLVHVHNEISNK